MSDNNHSSLRKIDEQNLLRPFSAWNVRDLCTQGFTLRLVLRPPFRAYIIINLQKRMANPSNSCGLLWCDSLNKPGVFIADMISKIYKQLVHPRQAFPPHSALKGWDRSTQGEALCLRGEQQVALKGRDNICNPETNFTILLIMKINTNRVIIEVVCLCLGAQDTFLREVNTHFNSSSLQ
jgi:hypothetical protein